MIINEADPAHTRSAAQAAIRVGTYRLQRALTLLFASRDPAATPPERGLRADSDSR
ncbi:hypothetical protein [Actinoplanes flavus]|uniref:Uncharacterized protein n=1 Tax=Actinoplanes flavus TaxID=2820290 RepID=A0ABS3UD84_9ACTN|nr:hypothetical protein [Actinoplanes flavus]MBO3736688.1 hypothetical protein [Actinoplanes flavus]